ncbi:MAG: tRNA uridine-5-carboxymethylaminomethyl(34) synthesis enzyme MnmG [Lentisphaeria bacterium]|nr:tRNA uridine-5-carboxymethylaminomethyl(34) synthesis enzyme MnmG [Lentisphaeria bacterium]
MVFTVKVYDVIVVGGGHAGCEAAFAAARAGAETLLITQNNDHIAQMSCNPAIGGVGKGQVVREIDAMGGAQGIVTDAAAIQFRMLNRGKGPAVWSPRAQCDKVVYQRGMKFLLENTPHLGILQSEVVAFLLENGTIAGVKTMFGEDLHSRTVVLANGTFLSGKMHFGLQTFPGGRAGDPASTALAQALREQLHLRVGRLKTGTPPRVLAQSIDFSAMIPQPAEQAEFEFSCRSRDSRPALPEAIRHDMPCYGVYSTPETAEIVKANLDQAPLYRGVIEGIGARYCPSFEDKVVRFAHHPRHLLFLEPEGAQTGEYYVNGISTSLPPNVQHQMLKSIPGMENVVISRYAYAIEYDFIYPDQLTRSLAQKQYENLFTAGQINGTSGYEEAAGQGLLAGLNAALYAAGKSTVELPRDRSYIGVMIDDLVTKDIVEPYRLFTSRAEYRLHLRQDNADLRLTEFAYKQGLIGEQQYRDFSSFKSLLDEALTHCRNTVHAGKTLFTWLKQLELSESIPEALPFPGDLLPAIPDTPWGRRVWQELQIEAHYDGYLQREAASIRNLHKLESWQIPADFPFETLPGLKNESRAKMLKVRPTTLAQAERIDGVTPAEIALLQVHLIRMREKSSGEPA